MKRTLKLVYVALGLVLVLAFSMSLFAGIAGAEEAAAPPASPGVMATLIIGLATVIGSVLAALAAKAVAALTDMLQAKASWMMSEERAAKINDTAATIVAAIEQTVVKETKAAVDHDGHLSTSEAKGIGRAAVAKLKTSLLAQFGIALSDDDASDYIEAAILEMKTALPTG